MRTDAVAGFHARDKDPGEMWLTGAPGQQIGWRRGFAPVITIPITGIASRQKRQKDDANDFAFRALHGHKAGRLEPGPVVAGACSPQTFPRCGLQGFCSQATEWLLSGKSSAKDI